MLIFVCLGFFRDNFAVIICIYSKVPYHQPTDETPLSFPQTASYILTFMICRAKGIHVLVNQVVLTVRDYESLKDLFTAGVIHCLVCVYYMWCVNKIRYTCFWISNPKLIILMTQTPTGHRKASTCALYRKPLVLFVIFDLMLAICLFVFLIQIMKAFT